MLFDTFSTVKKHDQSEANSELEEIEETLLDIDSQSEGNESDLNDDPETELSAAVDYHDQPRSSMSMLETECISSCCTDNVGAYQPTNKAVLSCFAKNGRNFVEKWYMAYPWQICVHLKRKLFCFYCKSAKKQGLLTFSSKAEFTFHNGRL